MVDLKLSNSDTTHRRKYWSLFSKDSQTTDPQTDRQALLLKYLWYLKKYSELIIHMKYKILQDLNTWLETPNKRIFTNWKLEA